MLNQCVQHACQDTPSFGVQMIDHTLFPLLAQRVYLSKNTEEAGEHIPLVLGLRLHYLPSVVLLEGDVLSDQS